MIRIKGGCLVTNIQPDIEGKTVVCDGFPCWAIPLTVDDLKGLRSDAGLELKRRKQRMATSHKEN